MRDTSTNGVHIDLGYKVDLLGDDLVIVELKAVERTIAVHEAQLLSYLKLSQRPDGLLIDINVLHLRDGIHRKFSDVPPCPPCPQW